MPVGSKTKVTETFVTLCGLPVKVQCIGKDVYENPKDLILLIPGNPGGVHFYSEFCKTLYQNLRDEGCGREISIWIVGHAGVDHSPEHRIPPLKGNEIAYSLEGQIRQKIQFVDEFVPRGCNLYLMGHSIGTKMSLEVYKYIQTDSVKELNVKYLYGLFPVIERMLESPNGPFHSKMFNDYSTPIYWIAYLLSLLPSMLLSCIVFFLVSWDSSEEIWGAVKQLINSNVVEKVLHLGRSEMREVLELKARDLEFMGHHTNRIRLYYGSSDKWCPLKYCYELKGKLPSLQAYICQKGIPHAFTLRRGNDMADIVTSWIKEVD